MAGNDDDWREKQPLQPKPPTMNRGRGAGQERVRANSSEPETSEEDGEHVVVPLRKQEEASGERASPPVPPPPASSEKKSADAQKEKPIPPPLEDFGAAPIRKLKGDVEGGGEEAQSVLPEESRDACYILSIGRAGSGKSTLQMHLLRYLIEGGENSVKVDPRFAGGTRAFQKTLRQWQECWRLGTFPEATPLGQPREFVYQVKPEIANRPTLKFGFVEMSGEDFRELTDAADAGRKPRFTNGLDHFLTSEDARIIFLFVVNGDKVTDDDSLFWLFLQHLDDLEQSSGRDFKRTCAACLVIADPENAQLRLANVLREQPDETVPLDAIAFAERFVPSTIVKLREWDEKGRGIIIPFSVGSVAERTHKNKTVRAIVEPDFYAAQTLFRWLYRRFTGVSAGRNDPMRPFRTFLRHLEALVERMNRLERDQ